MEKYNLTLTGFNGIYAIKKRKLKILKPIIEQWLRINREYIEEGDYEDSLYMYNERSTVGSLAGAVWRCGGYAQEEYSATKGDKNNEINGRIDLFFRFSHKNIIIEAKQLWIEVLENNRKNIKNLIEKSMKNAEEDIVKTVAANDYGDFNMAVTFVVPYWKEGTSQKENIKLIKKTIKELDSSMYIIFESKSKDVTSESRNGNTYIYNLCVAVFKDVV